MHLHVAQPDDDSHEEQWLPPDLALLAEQLGADAEFLASRYPAGPLKAVPDPAFALSAARPRYVRWAGVASAAAVLLAVGWALRPAANPLGPLLAQDAIPVVDRAVLSTTSAPALDVRPVRGRGFREASFEELSRPQQEAVLDLIEGESWAETSISI